MILQALYQLAHEEGLLGDPDYEVKPLAYLVRVGPNGRLINIESTHSKARQTSEGTKRRPQARPFALPREPSRTSGDRAFFLFDKSEYALGIDPEKDPAKRRPAEKLASRFALFRGRIQECWQASGDEAVGAVLTFLEDLAAGRQAVELPEEVAANDLFAFVYRDETDLISQRGAVRDYWKALRQQEPGDSVPCLVSGKKGPPADRHTVLKYVPGATSSGVPLVSFNQSAFESQGWKGNQNATVSRPAAEAYATALQRLLHPKPPDPSHPGSSLPRRNLRLGSGTVVCYWAPGSAGQQFASVFGALLEANPEEVAALYQSIWKGQAPQLSTQARFYALTLSGAQGRVMLRDWFESTVEKVASNLALHYADLAVVRNAPKSKDGEHPPHFPLRLLLRSLSPRGKDEEVSGSLAAQLFGLALRGAPYPVSLLQRAILRSRAEISDTSWAALQRRDARVALIKAVIERRRRFYGSPPSKEVQPDMDPTNTQPGYLLGRLMAVIERLQQLALKDVNASVVDRYFSAASAAPRTVFIRLLKNARHHARKAKDDPKTQGTARWLEGQIDELAEGFDPGQNGFPAHLSLEEQGLFILGYHQQRHRFFHKPQEAAQQSGDPKEERE